MHENLTRFKQILLQENQHINLISRQTSEEDLSNHIEDCLKIFDYLVLHNKNIVDVGSGGGLPGLVMAAVNRHNRYTLLEAERKKSEFLRKAADLMQMPQVKVIWGRAEDIGRDNEYRESFDICTSRAVAPIRIILEYCLPLIKEEGILILWKGPKYQEEIQDAQDALQALGGKIKSIYEYSLGSDRQRVLIIVRKVFSTPAKYPRRSGIPLKRPL